MKKVFLFSSIIIFIGVVIFVLFINLFLGGKGNIVNTNMLVVKNDAGIQVFSPKPDEIISSPLKITGFVNGLGWIGFEGQVGTVKLLDSKGNELAMGILTAQGEWMQIKINFETELKFAAQDDSIGYLVFHNENPSGEPLRDKIFTLPIKFK